MIMLYRDPKGESVGSFAPSLEPSGPNIDTNQSNTNEEEKVILLQNNSQGEGE